MHGLRGRAARHGPRARGSLETLLGDYGRLPPAYAAEVLDQLLAALSHIHGAGVVHRDVKPANLLLEPSPVGAPHVRLADFGIALGEDGLRFTTTGFTVGTPGYLAPEVLDWNRSGPRQDLYAAGMVAWRMLTGAAIPSRASGSARRLRACHPCCGRRWHACAPPTRHTVRPVPTPPAAPSPSAASTCGSPSEPWTASPCRSSTTWARHPAEAGPARVSGWRR